jgi:outer membrane protein assembly factor BamB
LSSPAVANGIVYVGSDDFFLWAFGAPSGISIGAQPTGWFVDSSPAVANGGVLPAVKPVVFVGSWDGNIYGFDQLLSATLFTATTGGPISLSSPAIADGMVFVGSLDNNVYAYSLAGGASAAPGAAPNPKTLVPDPKLKK